MEINISFGKKKKKEQPVVGVEKGFWYSPFDMSIDNKIENLDKIPISTYKKMAIYPQVAACLAIITFTIQKIDWYIKTDNKEMKEGLEMALNKIWNPLIRSISRAFKYGYSPNVLVFDKDEESDMILVSKIKDLKPEFCTVKVDDKGNFDGFYYQRGDSQGSGEYIQPGLSFWFTDDMEEGNFYGNSRLKNIYEPWYYIRKIHVFANRYYERFGTPPLIGRAPSGKKIEDSEGKTKNAQETLVQTLSALRNNSVAALPGDKDENGKYDYDIELLEGQMRGMDFQMYLNYLDALIMRGLFVPDLIYGGSSGGSYGLGKAQQKTFLANITAIVDNIADYVNKYILEPLRDINYGADAGPVEFIYQIQDDTIQELLATILTESVKNGSVIPDLDDLSERLGIQLNSVDSVDNTKKQEKTPADNPESQQQAMEIVKQMFDRVSKQIDKAIFSGDVKKLESIKLGYKGKYSDLILSRIIGFTEDNKENAMRVLDMTSKQLFYSLESEIQESMVRNFPDAQKTKDEVFDILTRVLTL